MYKRLAALVAFLFFGVSLVAVASPAHARDKNCSDFDTQAQAQDYLDQQGGGDPDGLDADDDGIACETLPCPCSTGGGGGGGGGGDGGGGKKKHVIKISGQEIRDTGKFRLSGKVPTFKNGKGIQILRKLTQEPYKKYKTTRTNGRGKVRNKTFGGPLKTCFKVVVPARGQYRKTQKGIGCIVPG
ncbi:MAG: Competence protein ComEC/Rec2-related protein [Nocardioides sp.]|nr:Competence protein ComEC/Rec2-related protein [Nocardioides sp.]